MHPNRKLAALALGASLILLSACGSSGGTKTINTPNGQVKVNGDGSGSYSLTLPDGTKVQATRAKDGTVTYTDSKGNKQTYNPGTGSDGHTSGTISSNGTTVSYDGGTGKLPADWPKDLDPPSSVKITTSLSSTEGNKKNELVNATSTASPKDLYDGLKSQLSGAGYKITSDNFYDAGSTVGGTLEATKGDATVNAIIGSSGSGTTVSLTYSVPA